MMSDVTIMYLIFYITVDGFDYIYDILDDTEGLYLLYHS